jgi:hypothetical protein
MLSKVRPSTATILANNKGHSCFSNYEEIIDE